MSDCHLLEKMAGYRTLYICIHLVVFVFGDIGVQHLTSFVGVTFKDCFEQCQNRVSCRSILYRHRITYCRLYGQYISNYTLGKRIPGLYYREKESEYSSIRNGSECKPGETCEEGTCKLAECPIPTADDDIRIVGNLRTIGSKIRYECRNLFTQPVHSMCNEYGSWFPASMSCDTNTYAYSVTDTYKGKRYEYIAGSSRFTLQSKYLDTCLSRCNETTQCFGINFSPERNTCVSTTIRTTQSDVNSQLMDVAGWNHYYRILPIAWYSKSGERYAFQFDEAVAYSIYMGTSIASLADLKKAVEMYYHLCLCRWLEDGKIYVPLTTTCGNFEPGVSQFTHTIRADVYCKDKRFKYN